METKKPNGPLGERQRCTPGVSLLPIPPDVLGALAVQEFWIEARCWPRPVIVSWHTHCILRNRGELDLADHSASLESL